MSALLFLLCVEILGIKLRANNSQKGFCFGQGLNPIKLTQYADDCILFLNSKSEVCSALNILKGFGQLSGLILNIDKCEGLWLGKDKNLQCHCNLFGIKWPEQFRCLGVYLGHNKQINDKKNFEEKVDCIEIILKKWEKRELTLFGRVLVLKTFALSKLILPATTMCIPLKIMKRINTLFYKFLWRSRDKVKRIRVIQSLDNGGLNMINTKSFFDSLHARWITRILETDPNMNSWVQIPNILLGSLNIDGLNLRFNFDENVSFPQTELLPCFYKHALQYFNKAYVSDKPFFERSILNQPLWGNKYITHNIGRKKCVLFLRNWIRSGVRIVGDLPFKNGILDEHAMYQTLNCKQNVHCELMLVKNALYPYRRCIECRNSERVPTIRCLRSKDYYNMYREQLTHDANITCVTKYLDFYCNNNDGIVAFHRKVVLEKEIKLREFNFKVLHGILPCNRNLKNWKIKICDNCDVCNQTQTIEHLLYSCCYVRPLWRIVNTVFGINIDYYQILGLDREFRYDAIVTIVCFLIYKEWLLLSLDSKSRSSAIVLDWYKYELKVRMDIYKQCNCIDSQHVENLQELIMNL